MSVTPTLHSRLRVLVAKAFRAEKLYSTVNNSRAERLSNMAALAEAASDIRAREWQRSHYQLRTALNDVLALGNSAAIVKEVHVLRDSFLRKSKESSALVERGAEELVETARRHEFAHIFKISVELIRHKAQAQACRVIADELTSVLDTSKATLTEGSTESTETGARLLAASVSVAPPPLPEEALGMDETDLSASVRSNVIQLKRRIAFGRRKS